MTSLACSFSVELYDSYGDGWNGGSLTVYVNGSAVLTNITLSSGSGPATYTFDANTGDEITTNYTEGNWPEENWYEIKDAIGSIIATDGDNTKTITPSGISIPIIANCPLDLDATISEISTNDYAGEHEIYATLKNIGNDTIFNSTIGWKIDGISQTPVSWSDTLASNETEQILLGSYTFETGTSYLLTVWSETPNGGTDENTLNDTLIYELNIAPAVSIFTNDTSNLFLSSEDNEILGININTKLDPITYTLDSIKLNPVGSDNFITDVTKIKIYSTEDVNSFNNTELVWEGTTLDEAIFIDSSLNSGSNYYWVAVDVSDIAQIENIIQVTCDYLVISGAKYYPNMNEPFGKRAIIEKPKYYNFMPASIVVGQPDFYTQNTTLDEYTGVGSNNSAVSSKGVLAVGSQSRGRILIWNEIPDTNGTPADIVLGNPDFYTLNNGPTASYIRNVEGVCFSPDGEKLIASDGNNNRVLIWNSIPDTSNTPADVVIGQTDFTSGSSGIGPDKLNYPGGVAISSDGKLIITELYNNRVLIYNQIPTINGASADVVVGQDDFYSNSSGIAANKLNGPWYSDVSLDGKLIVTDRMNNRVLVFNELPTHNGASADVVIGQTDFVSNSSGTSDTKLNIPIGVTISPKGELAIGEFSNNRVLIYNKIPDTNGTPANIVLGQPDFNSNTAFNGGISEKSMRSPYGINFDLNGRLYVNGRDMHRVMIYGELPTDTADLRILITSNKSNPHVGESITYTFTLTNNGPNNSSDIVLKSALPGLFKLENYTVDKGEFLPYGGTWNIPYIASGESIDLILDGTIEDGGGNITTYSNIIASSAIDNNMDNNATSLIIDVINDAPVISVFDKDTIVQGTSTEWIPFTISDTDSDISKIEVTAVSSDETILNNTLIELMGTTGNRYLKATPFAVKSGAVNITVTVSDGFSENQSSFELYILSNNANLSDLDTSGTTITGFRADSLHYTCVLNASALTAPTVTATAESDKAIVNIYETDSLSGITTVDVTAEDGVTTNTYLVTFIYSVNADNDASLKDLKLDGATIDGFSPIKYQYTKYLPYGTAIVPTVLAVPTNELAGIAVNQTVSLPGKDSITVTATDGITEQLYIIEYFINSASTNNNLNKIIVDGEEIATFDPEVLDYTIEYPYGTTSVPMVLAIPDDANAFVDQTDATSMPGTTTLDVYAEDGSLKTYTIEFTLVAASTDATLSKIKVNGSPIFGFDPSVYSYDIELEPSVTVVPTVVAEATHDSAIVVITPAGSLPGTTEIAVTAQDGVTELIYLVNFTYRPLSNISLLSDLKVDGVTIDDFNPNILNYMYKLPVGTTIPASVTATVYDSKATKVIVNATSVPGTSTITVTAEDGSTSEYSVYFTFDNLSSDATLNDIKVDATTIAGFNSATLTYNVELPYGTTVVPDVTATATDGNAQVDITAATSLPGKTTIVVTAEDEFTENTYEVNFTIAPNSDATLSDLKINATTIAGFNSATLTYNVELPYGTTVVPDVTATATDDNAQVDITDATSLPGKTTIVVTAEDEITEKTYEVNFTVAPNSDATLSDLKVNATTIAGFNSATLIYNVELPSGTTVVPDVTATATDANADVSITDATTLPGTTLVIVTAEDETTTKNYSVNFTISTSVNELSLNNNINIYPNPSNGIFIISIEIDNISYGSIDIYNSTGSKVYIKNLQNNTDFVHTIDLSTMPKGMYFVKIIVNEKSFTNELIIE
ncbi:MAG: hypothetical protein A2X13_03005 [Bacteroidetes bacterium GWC2_33_15]|nr:MAG: hypothetical protein A2X10_09540 [Bacteroidetes bacterium GWA2_33_15]OFX49516.1 MAG: hypothetical protein A2X13_03005 [Bacteroidetes bacterium GWC2_33_15]OFX63645.1 MAG: hypothetical protein A2X15_01220 [Bacteroidetes bacterium GWB2_32_14]OFX68859.1 MAG: hypothetical protein A2X14_13215 [Bacteroidetes bacterium GWD2_33_33]